MVEYNLITDDSYDLPVGTMGLLINELDEYYHNKPFEIVISEGCEGCMFQHDEDIRRCGYVSNPFHCAKIDRKDFNNIIIKELK